MRAPLPILFAMGTEADEPDRLTGRWAPALAASGLRAEALWCPLALDDAVLDRAAESARALGVPVRDGVPAPAAAVLTTAHGPALRTILLGAAGRGIPVLLDRPCTDPPDLLRALLGRSLPPLVLDHHLGHHRGFTRALRAVQTAEIGLLRGVALDLVSSDPAGNSDPVEVLRDLGGQALDLLRNLTGSATLRLHARPHPSGSWTLLAQSGHDVVLSAHLSRLHGAAAPVHALLRVTGTDGYLTVDLTAPALQVRTATGMRPLPYGEGAEAAVLTQLGAVARGEAAPHPPEDLLVLVRALEQIEQSAPSADPTTLIW